jgi:WD40 repeat protein
VEAIASSSDSLFALNQRLDALVQALGAQQLLTHVPWVDRSIALHAKNSLLQATYGMEEVNRLPGGNAIAASAEGQKIAVASDRVIQLWQPDGTLDKTLTGHQGVIQSIAFHRQLLASASEDGTARIWRDGAAVVLRGHRAAVRQVAFSPDGTIAATASIDGSVKLWQPNGSLMQTLQVNGAVTDVIFSPNGKTLAAIAHPTLRLWRVAQGKADFSQDLVAQGATSISFGAKGKTLAANAGNGVEIWRRDRTGGFAANPVQTLSGEGSIVNKVRFSADGRTLATTTAQITALWNRNGDRVQTFNQPATDLTFSPDGRTLMTTGSEQTRLWRVENSALTTIKLPIGVEQVAFRTDGQAIAALSQGTVQLWKANGMPLGTPINIAKGSDIAFSADGQTLADVENGGVALRRVAQPSQIITTLKSDGIERMIWSSDGRMATAGQDIKLWSKDGKLIRTLTGHLGKVRAIAFSADGQTLVSGGEDGSVRVWNADGTVVQTMATAGDRITEVALSPNGQRVAAIAGETLNLWSANGQSLEDWQGQKHKILKVAFSPNGNQIVTADADHVLKLWDLNGTEIATLKGHLNPIETIAFSADSGRLMSASEDGTIKLWRIDLLIRPDRLKTQACESVRNYLRSHFYPESPAFTQEARQFCS